MLIQNDEIITDGKELVETFNKHYINIVEKSSRIKPVNVAMMHNICDNDTAINVIVEAYKNHPNVTKIKEIIEKNTTKCSFKIDSVTKAYITTLLKNIDIKKATVVDRIPPKLVKLSANILPEPLTKTINDSLIMAIFADATKIAAVSPIDKGNDNKNSISNFGPVSILSVFSKIFEVVIKNQLALYVENIFSPFLSAYPENCSTQHVLIRLVEDWKKHLDNNEVVRGVLMDLPKVYNCIPRDLLIANLSADGFDKTALQYIYSYLKKRQQCVRINNICTIYIYIYIYIYMLRRDAVGCDDIGMK